MCPLRCRQIPPIPRVCVTVAMLLALSGCEALPAAGLSLSAGSIDPGRVLTIYHPSIKAGSRAKVTIAGPRGFAVTLYSSRTEAGSVKVGVPPLVELSSASYFSGEATVSVEGVPGTQRLTINKLPQVVTAYHGEIVVAYLEFAISANRQTLADIAALTADLGGGSSAAPLVASLNEQITQLESMRDQIRDQHKLSLDIPGVGTVDLLSAELSTADRWLNSVIRGLHEELASNAAAKHIRRMAGEPFDANKALEDILQSSKDNIVPGVTVLAQFTAATLGTWALYEVATATAATLAAAEVGVLIAATGGVAVLVGVGALAATTAFGANTAISSVRNENPDAYRDSRESIEILQGTAVDVGLILAGQGAPKTVGHIIDVGATIKSVHDGSEAYGKLRCAVPTNQKTIGRMSGAPPVLFCQVVQDFAGPTAPGAPASAQIVVTAYRNPDGTTGADAAKAAIQLSGNLSSLQVSWTGVRAYSLLVDQVGTEPVEYGLEPRDRYSFLYLTPPITYGNYAVAGYTAPSSVPSIAAPLSFGRYIVTVRGDSSTSLTSVYATLEFEFR